MKYRNIKTGVVIEVATKLSGANWEPVGAKAGVKPAKAATEEPKEVEKPKATKKAKAETTKKSTAKRGKKK